jgi:pectinesterase
VDYIFGDGSAWFGECEFQALIASPIRPDNLFLLGTIASSGGGYVTATSRTYPNDTAWYVIDHSTVSRFPCYFHDLRTNQLLSNVMNQVTAASGASVKGKVFLGRPWRVLARVIYQYSTLTDVVHPEGWTTMAEGATP